jgi:hypothetical protein
MAEAETQKLPAVQCEYLTPGGADLADVFTGEQRRAFVVLDMQNGTLRTHVTERESPPVLVGALYFLRWPIAPVTNDRVNSLLEEIAPRAATLIQRVNLRAGGGVLFPTGVGSAIDRIQLACAATWDDSARLTNG